MTTPPTTPRTAPTTVPGVGEVSRKAYVAGMERIWSALFCIVFSREVAGSGIGSSRVTSFDEDREINAEERSRTKRIRGSVRDNMGAIVGDSIILEYGSRNAIESTGRIVTLRAAFSYRQRML